MAQIATKDPKFVLRFATTEDAGLVLEFMKKLGTYQQMADQITATEASLHRLLSSHHGEAIFGVFDGETVAFMFFNQTSSAFTGRSGLYIDGFFVDDTMRHKGLGRIMMDFMCTLAADRGCQMLEWGCLDWNAPTIEFYKGLGAYCLDTMRIYRLGPDKVAENGARF
jgi:GNAT superfamily N-acetyltransferase